MFINIITVGFGATRVIRRHQQVVEVLLHRNDRAYFVVDTEQRIPSRVGVGSVEIVNNALPDNRERVILLKVFVQANVGEDFRGDVRPLVRLVDIVADL